MGDENGLPTGHFHPNTRRQKHQIQRPQVGFFIPRCMILLRQACDEGISRPRLETERRSHLSWVVRTAGTERGER
jgi:hypothetical protein